MCVPQRARWPFQLGAIVAIALSSACGSGGGGGSATTVPTVAANNFTAQFSFTIPAVSNTQGARRAQYISASSESVEIDVVYAGGTTPGLILNLDPLPSTCTSTAGTVVCNVSVVAQASAQQFVVKFFDRPNAEGNLLSTATVPVPTASGGVASVNLTLQGVAAGVSLVLQGTLVNGFAGTATMLVTALDADGNAISGTAALSAPIQLTSSDPALTLSPATIANPSTAVTIAYSGVADPGLRITAVPPTGPPITFVPFNATVGSLSVNPASVDVSVGGPSALVTVGQAGPSGTITLTSQCSGSAAITVAPASIPVGTSTTVSITAVTAPATAAAPACTITASGAAGSSATIAVNVNQNQFSVNSRQRDQR